nr:LuxR C-terminal-related transcriptional regulator [Solimonas marina]
MTPREMQVLYLTSSGRTLRDVALVLRISEQTAQRHRLALYRKLCVRNMAELLRKVFLEGCLNWRIEAADRVHAMPHVGAPCSPQGARRVTTARAPMGGDTIST